MVAMIWFSTTLYTTELKPSTPGRTLSSMIVNGAVDWAPSAAPSGIFSPPRVKISVPLGADRFRLALRLPVMFVLLMMFTFTVGPAVFGGLVAKFGPKIPKSYIQALADQAVPQVGVREAAPSVKLTSGMAIPGPGSAVLVLNVAEMMPKLPFSRTNVT